MIEKTPIYDSVMRDIMRQGWLPNFGILLAGDHNYGLVGFRVNTAWQAAQRAKARGVCTRCERYPRLPDGIWCTRCVWSTS